MSEPKTPDQTNGGPDGKDGKDGKDSADGRPVPAAGKNPFAAVKFVLEFVELNNCHTACPVTKRRYRGRFDMTSPSVKGKVPDDRFASCPSTPGHVLIYDGATRTVEVVDPLGHKDQRETLAALRAAYQAMNWPKPTPDEPRVYRQLSDDKLKAWAYWARRWVDGKQVEVREGKVPAMELVDRLPGRVERNTFDTSALRARWQDPETPYVTVKEAAGLQG